MALGNGSAGDYSGTLKLTSLITAPLTYATLPASPTAGQRAYITDGNSTTYYATVSSGGGSSKFRPLQRVQLDCRLSAETRRQPCVEHRWRGAPRSRTLPPRFPPPPLP